MTGKEPFMLFTVLCALAASPGHEESRDLFYESYFSAPFPGRVDSLLALLEREPDLPAYWRGLARMYCCADTTRTDSLLQEWIRELPWDPRAWLLAAETSLDREQFDRVTVAADRGLEAFALWRPEGVPEAEWLLVAPALLNDLKLLRCQGFYGRGDRMAALEELAPLLEPGLFHVDDYHTGARYLFTAGTWHLEMGYTLGAVDLLLRSAVEGDMRNMWASGADSLLHEILGDGYMTRCRALAGYTGPVFQEVPLPDPVPGTRHCWGHVDHDGRPDLLSGGTVLLNTPGGFVRYDSLPVNGGVIADLNGDGLTDILGLGRQPLLFLATVEGGFREAALSMGLDSVMAQVEGAAVLDWNGDGYPDIYLAVYEDPDSMGLGRPDAFYLGGPSGFTRAPGFQLDPPLCGRSVSVVDLHGNGSPSIFVSNYRLDPNVLWENVDGQPVNTAQERGLAGVETEGAWGHTIGSAWCDFDMDGDMDVFCANLAHPRFITFSDRSMLLRNDGGVFTDTRAEMGIKYDETHSFPVWGDFNLDGLPDLFVTSVYPDRRSFLYINTGDGFTDVTWLAGARVFDGWHASSVDFNLDGIPDITVNTGGFLKLLSTAPEWAGEP